MRPRISWLVLLPALFATIASAAPKIDSISVNHGPAAGGTVVSIKGSGFSTCIICSPPTPPGVLFGSVPAASVTLVNDSTIEAVTPVRPAGTVAVTVDQYDGQSTLEQAFTFTGDFTEGLEPVLVPVFTPPAQGAFGSEFRTTAVASHKGGSGRVFLYGLDTACFLFSPHLGPYDVRLLEPNETTLGLAADCSTWPAKLFWVSKSQANDVTFNARVRDVSRSDRSHGTEMPIVRASDFSTDAIVLLNVPIDPRFRNTLRLYSLMPAEVTVSIDGREQIFTLQSGRDIFEPSYLAVSDFPSAANANGATSVRLTVRPYRRFLTPPGPDAPIWAFVTVTNNTTQEITTITPD